MLSAKIDTMLRRWCETCGRATRSRIDAWGNETCAEHRDRWEDDDDWEEEDWEVDAMTTGPGHT